MSYVYERLRVNSHHSRDILPELRQPEEGHEGYYLLPWLMFYRQTPREDALINL